MSEIDRLDYVTGQTHALGAFAAALARLMRDDENAKVEINASFQVALAKMENTRATDKAILGFQEMTAWIQRFLSALPETQ